MKRQGRFIGLVAMCAVVLFLTARQTTLAAASVVADYRFNASHDSAVGSAPALVDIGANSFVTETVDGTPCTVLMFAEGNGLTLATEGVITQDTYSLVMLFRLDTTSGYRKIADFKNGTSDTGLYNLSGNLRFYSDAVGSNSPFQDNVYAQAVLTRDGATKTITGYVDGTQEFQFTDTSDNGVISDAKTLRFLLDDELTGSEESGGAVARIRLYDGVLTAQQIADLDRAHVDCGGEPVITVQNSSPAFEYTGWQGVEDAGASGGTYRQSKMNGGKVSLKFNGTGIKYQYRAGPTMGKVDVYIDKVKVKTLCLYAAAPATKNKNFKNLAGGKHTFELRVRNQTCNGSTDSYVSLDKAVVGATTLEDNHLKWNWNGWGGKGDTTANGGNYHSSRGGGAFARLNFSGTSVQVLTLKGPEFGYMDVVIDGTTLETLNLSNGSLIAYSKNYSGLGDLNHTIELRRNALSGKKPIVVDGVRGPLTLP